MKLTPLQSNENNEFGYVSFYFEDLSSTTFPYVAKLTVKENTNPESKYKYALNREFVKLKVEQHGKNKKVYGNFTVKVGDLIEMRGGVWNEGDNKYVYLITAKENEDKTLIGRSCYVGDIGQSRSTFAKVMKYLTGEMPADELTVLDDSEKAILEKVKNQEKPSDDNSSDMMISL